MPGRFNPMVADDMAGQMGEEIPPESPLHLVGDAGAPPQPTPPGGRPGVPRGQNMLPTQPSPRRSSQQAAGSGMGYPGLSRQDVEDYKAMMREQYPDMDEGRFNQLVEYGIQKQRGRIAAQNKKVLAGPIGKYFSALQSEANARMAVEAAHEGMKSKKFEFTRKDGTVDPQFSPFQDKIDVAIKKAEAARQRRQEVQQMLERMGVMPQHLESPVTVMEFMRQLAMGDPGTANELPDDDPIEQFGDMPQEEMLSGANVLQ